MEGGTHCGAPEARTPLLVWPLPLAELLLLSGLCSAVPLLPPLSGDTRCLEINEARLSGASILLDYLVGGIV